MAMQQGKVRENKSILKLVGKAAVYLCDDGFCFCLEKGDAHETMDIDS